MVARIFGAKGTSSLISCNDLICAEILNFKTKKKTVLIN
jgi:hypothetical protein